MKHESNSKSMRDKARLMVKGFHQRNGVDFNETFSHVVKISLIKVRWTLKTTLDLEVEQKNVKTLFLYGDFEEQNYMKQLNDFLVEGKEDYVSTLIKSIYFLKQASRKWYKKFELVINDQGYIKNTSDYYVFVRKKFILILSSSYYMFMI